MVSSDLLDSAKVPSIKDVGTFFPPLVIYGSEQSTTKTTILI